MAADALTPHLVRQAGTIDLGEAELGEEIDLVGQAENALQTDGGGFGAAGINELATDALAMSRRCDSERLQFGDFVGVDVQCSTADQAANLGFGDDEVADVLVEFTERTRQEQFFFSPVRKQRVDPRDVFETCRTDGDGADGG